MAFKLFRHHQDEIWQRASEAIGGRFLDEQGWRHDKIVVESGDWTIRLELTTEPGFKDERIYTRISTPLRNPEGLRFAIRPETLLKKVTHLLGAEDVHVGCPELDAAFEIKTNQPEKIRRLCANPTLRNLLNAEKGAMVFLGPPYGHLAESVPAGNDVLVLLIPGEVKELARLERIYRLFAETLKTVTLVLPDYENDPDVASD